MNARQAYFAGSWYPGTEGGCLREMESFSRQSVPCPDAGTAVGGIVPHAGWLFSGHIAFNVIDCICRAMKPQTWVLFGQHLRASEPFNIMKEGQWSTPLGHLAIDAELADTVLSDSPFTVEEDRGHRPDNTIELQLPFLKYFTPDSMILPAGAPPSFDCLALGARIVEAAKGLGRTIAVLGSTDLTHYGYNYGYSPKGGGQQAVEWVRSVNDRRIVDLIVRMDGEGVLKEASSSRNACCAGAVAAAVSAAGSAGAGRGRELLYATSYDKHKDSSFVGYVGVVFYM